VRALAPAATFQHKGLRLMDVHFVGRSRAVSGKRAWGRRRSTPRPPAEVLEARLLLSQDFPVTNTSDNTSTGSLRWAIGQVNADATDTAASPDRIVFNIPTNDPGYNAAKGVWTIAPTSALPTVARPALIDGYAQPGATPNTSLLSDDAVLKIDLAGNGSAYDGLAVSSGGSTVQGLVIRGFGQAGVRLTGAGGDVVAGNFIGTDATGLSGDGDQHGVLVRGSNNTVGGTTLAARNIVAASSSDAIGIINGGSNNLVAGNFVGLSASGNSTLQLTGGIDLSGGPGNTIGGAVAAARNVVAAGFFAGIFDDFSSPGHNLIEGNYVGTNAAGTSALFYHDPASNPSGIETYGPGDTIGGTGMGTGNLASGMPGDGILVQGDSSLVQGNLIGTDASGTKAIANGLSGVGLGGNNETIGGTASGAANVISGNNIGIRYTVGSGESILGNRIGTDATGLIPLGNTSDGIRVEGGARLASIGGALPVAGNTIAYSGGAGVNILGEGSDSPTGISILSNSIHDNARLGIDLGGDGVTPNTPGGPHVGPNDLQNYPVLTAADPAGGETTVVGTLNSTPNSTFTVQFFANTTADPSGYGQGKTYLGQLTGVKTDASGNASFTFFAPVGVAGQFLSATATDPNGNTSEFARDIQAIHVPSADVAVSVLNSTASTTVGGPVGFTFRITNLGPDVATGIAVVDMLPASLGNATIAASEGQSTLVDGKFTDFVASLPVGGSFTVVVTGTATAAGTIANDLVAAAAEPDPDPSNNTAGVAIPVAPLPAATTTTLVAMPNPAVAGQPVTFTATVAPASPEDGPTGVVTFFIDGIGHAAAVVPSAGGLAGTATYTATFPTAGTHGVVALYNGDASFAPSVSTSMFETVNPAPPVGPPPRVVEVLRYGYHALPTQLVVEFNEPLDLASAQNPGNYAIVGPRGRPIAVVSASLMPGGTAVLLRLRGRLDVHQIYTLTVAGGVKSITGVPMGSEQVELVTFRNLVWRPAPPAVHAVDAALASGGLSHRGAAVARVRRR
jgi:uncharacterized repeat protein (TIGR01451 family)